MKFVKVRFAGQLLSGAYIPSTFVELKEDYTMLQLVVAIRDAGFASFMLLDTMKKLVDIV